MALVDTQGFVMAVDRSLFGPQGRRWIERKLPDVVTNLAFIGVSAVGALILCFHVSFVTRLQFCVEPHHPVLHLLGEALYSPQQLRARRRCRKAYC